MRSSSVLLSVSIILVLINVTTLFADPIQLIVNGSFEEGSPRFGRVPSGNGYWQGNVVDYRVSEYGIVPTDGDRMLRFIYTRSSGPGSTSGSQYWQWADLSPYREEVLAGRGRISAFADFNRVAGDDYSDTQFDLLMYDVTATASHCIATSSVFTDSEVQTWETASLINVVIPPDYTGLLFAVQAIENITNDVAGVEFDGHYADNVRIYLWFSSLTGDLNEDGTVSSRDLDIVRAWWYADVTPGELDHGDANGDGIVNSHDLNLVRSNWGNSVAASSVPEPSTLIFILTGLAFSMVRFRRR